MPIINSVAIVTGGATGIGRAMVQQLLKRKAKRVIIADTNAAAGAETAHQLNAEDGNSDKCHFVNCSVTDLPALRKAFQLAVDLEGKLDIVANNAGIIDESKPDLMIDINVKGVINGSRLALEFMSKQSGGNGGVVVNTASAAGLFTSAFVPAYAASKHAVVGWTGSMGSEMHFKMHGVRFNCLCPAYIETNMVTDCLKADSQQTLMSPKLKTMMKQAPLIPMELLIDNFTELVENELHNGVAVSILPPDSVKYYDKSMKALL